MNENYGKFRKPTHVMATSYRYRLHIINENSDVDRLMYSADMG